jgi:hypothetical protein
MTCKETVHIVQAHEHQRPIGPAYTVGNTFVQEHEQSFQGFSPLSLNGGTLEIQNMSQELFPSTFVIGKPLL